MINGLLLQCGHKVIISMNKREISKEIIPFFFSKSSSYTNILHENFLSLEIEKLLLTLDDLMEDIRIVEEEIQLFIFRKKENVVIGTHIESREVSYFRMIFIKDNNPAYEDYDYQILFDRDKFKELMYSKLNSFKDLLSLPLLESIDIQEHDILFPPAIGGYFIHETVGHLLESDNISILNLSLKCSN